MNALILENDGHVSEAVTAFMAAHPLLFDQVAQLTLLSFKSAVEIKAALKKATALVFESTFGNYAQLQMLSMLIEKEMKKSPPLVYRIYAVDFIARSAHLLARGTDKNAPPEMQMRNYPGLRARIISFVKKGMIFQISYQKDTGATWISKAIYERGTHRFMALPVSSRPRTQ